jgi:hypothetical protein
VFFYKKGERKVLIKVTRKYLSRKQNSALCHL